MFSGLVNVQHKAEKRTSFISLADIDYAQGGLPSGKICGANPANLGVFKKNFKFLINNDKKIGEVFPM